MNEFEKLIYEAEKEGLKIFELAFESSAKGLIVDNIIGINTSIDTVIEKKCILAEEMGHYYTNSGDVLDLSKLENIKQENKAMAWSFEKLIGLDDIIRGFEANCINKFELAEFLNVTLEFLEESIKYYRRKYGVYVNAKDNYTIIFEPTLAVLKEF